MTENPAIQKYKYIDALRGIAIIGVLYVHNYNYFDYGNNNFPVWFLNSVEFAQRGVQLFFIASAFTLCLSLNSRMKKEKNYLQNFFVRRFFRIAPLFYFITIFFILAFNKNFSLTNILGNFSFLYVLHPIANVGIAPYSWTIGVEMFFYILFPILFFRIKNLNQAVIFTILSSIIYQSIYLFSINHIDFIQNHFFNISEDSLKTFFYRSVLGQLPVFSLGFVFFHYQKEGKIKPTLILLIALAILVQLIFGILFSEFTVFSLGLLLFTIALSLKEFKFFVNKITTALGKISYSLYLTHGIILILLNNLSIYQFVENDFLNLRFILFIILACIISTVTYYLIEKPGIKLGNNLIRNLNLKGVKI